MWRTILQLLGFSSSPEGPDPGVALYPKILAPLKPASLFSLEYLDGEHLTSLLRFAIADKSGKTIVWQYTDALGKLGIERFGWEARDAVKFGRQEVKGSEFNMTVRWASESPCAKVEVVISCLRPLNLLALTPSPESSVFPVIALTSVSSKTETDIADDWDIGKMVSSHRVEGKNWLIVKTSKKEEKLAHIKIFRLKKSADPISINFAIGQKNCDFHPNFDELEKNWREDLEKKFPGLRTPHAIAALHGNLAFVQGPLPMVGEASPPNLALLSITPSRSFFPRPFLWDEGFHSLVLAKTHPELFCRIFAGWLAVQQSDGWIPRELALGEEDRSRVPPQFIPQSSHIANPPTLLFGLRTLIINHPGLARSLLTGPRLRALEKWFNWLKKSQKSSRNCFRWKGRDSAHTLGSGLDDYPRGLFVNDDECHLDLHAWLLFFAKCMSSISDFVEIDEIMSSKEWRDEYSQLLVSMEVNLFSKSHGIFSDFLGLQPITSIPPWSQDGRCGNGFGECDPSGKLPCCSGSGWCGSGREYCDCERCKKPGKPLRERKEWLKSAKPIHSESIGYVSLFPLILGVIEIDCIDDRISCSIDVLTKIVDLIEFELMTPFGVSSLSPKDPNFGKGENYWRGNLWGNFQLLIVGALRGYANRLSTKNISLSQRMFTIADDIAHKYTSTVRKNLDEKGFIFEIFSPLDGQGKGAAPFTGWTAVALALLESGNIWWDHVVGIGGNGGKGFELELVENEL